MLPVVRRRAGVLLAAVLLASCQPVEEGVAPPGGEDAGAAPTEALGSPASRLPDDLEELLADLESSAAEWQAEPRVVEVAVELDGEAWRRASVTYLAPDADRFLLVQVTPEGTTQQRPTLATMELRPVPGEGLAQVPPWPDGALDPVPLAGAAAEARRECGVGDDLASVVYATGAPAAWDGESWTEPPAWTATVSDGEVAVALDPVTGAALGGGCIAAADPGSGRSTPQQ